ncbi:lycopene cyclase domain-containing protein [Algoriphagus sediminis]|uniref:Lycopene cyclase domain-containing protein n=1 Tax=Algoriphagus sediminis TaxID=3057113 RepID=A0ABT7YAV9_9BACT|nr:lycopene cyclase domain-containing protein [Algoriphagus sediminis]MDN3203659.1 lycopene cyclase domain-containing protein [Algoriphagus sediminis]
MLPDKYAYLSLALLYLLAWLVVFIYSPYKRGMIKVGAVGGLMGVVAEVWYFRDYWRPPTLFGQGIPGIEDYLIGFAMFGVGGYIYSSFTKREIDYSKKTPAKYRDFFWLFIAGVSSMTIFSIGFNIHSGYVTFFTFFFLSVYIWIQRPDLIGISLISAVAVGVITFVIYSINFNILFPNFWDDYGMLDDKPILGIRVANIPLSEMLWHTTWGMLCSMFRGYRNGVYYK